MQDGGQTTASTGAPQGSAWTVVAGPFTRADRLRGFIAAVGGIEGVTRLVARRFRGGQLSLSVCYRGTEPLAGRLAALAEFSPRVDAETSVAIWLELGEGRQGSEQRA